jgi:hypothetical protein
MSKDQIIKPAVTTAVAAAAANTMQSRISLPSHAGPLTEISLQALNKSQLTRSVGPCDDDTEVGSSLPKSLDIRLMSRWQFRLAVENLPLMSWLRDREDIRVFWMSCGGEK